MIRMDHVSPSCKDPWSKEHLKLSRKYVKERRTCKFIYCPKVCYKCKTYQNTYIIGHYNSSVRFMDLVSYIFFIFSIWCLALGLNSGFTSNKSTYYGYSKLHLLSFITFKKFLNGFRYGDSVGCRILVGSVLAY